MRGREIGRWLMYIAGWVSFLPRLPLYAYNDDDDDVLLLHAAAAVTARSSGALIRERIRGRTETERFSL